MSAPDAVGGETLADALERVFGDEFYSGPEGIMDEDRALVMRAAAALRSGGAPPEEVEIREQEDGVDEIVMRRGAFHLERLDEDLWWVALNPEGHPDRVTFTISGKRTKLTVTEEFAARRPSPEPTPADGDVGEARWLCNNCGVEHPVGSVIDLVGGRAACRHCSSGTVHLSQERPV